MRSPQHTIIQTGQKTIIQPHTAYVYQQHKLSPGIPPAALKVLSSQLATEQSLTHGLQNNVIVRAISQNTTPPLTILPGASELQPQIAIVNSNGSMNLQSLPSSGSSKTWLHQKKTNKINKNQRRVEKGRKDKIVVIKRVHQQLKRN